MLITVTRTAFSRFAPAGFSLHFIRFMPADIHQHAGELLKFIGDIPVASRLAACKEFLKSETAASRERHAKGASGLEIAHDRAATIDELLRHLFDYAMTSYVSTHGPL